MKILIDNGHGADTKGKCSPDGIFREYKYTREIAESIERELSSRGYDAERIVTEENDVPLKERVRRVNEFCDKLGTANVILVSIHCNASPPDDGKWHNARGWSAYTSKGKTKSDELATMMYEAAEHHFTEQKIRKDFSDGDPDWEESFYILRNTKCPAVLTENLFQDNQKDVSYLLSLEGKTQIVKVHIEAITKYVNKYEND